MTKLGALPFLDTVRVLYFCYDASIILRPLSKLLSKKGVRILCYHRVCDLPKTKDFMRYLSVSPEVFDQQMAFLSQNKYNVITLEQFIEYKHQNIEPPHKTVIITFDDGYRDNFINAFPILRKYNFKGTFFVVTDYINGDRIFHWLNLGKALVSHCEKNKQYWLPLTKDDILNMNAEGACFGSHTKTHSNLNSVDEHVAMEELRGSKQRLEEILSKPIICFSYPYRTVNRLSQRWVGDAGYSAAVTVKGGVNTLDSDLRKLRRTSIYG